MDKDTFQGFMFKALIWGLTYYFIRRGLNPEVKDLEKYKVDTMYGALASFITGISFWYVQKYVIPRI